jgi:hypothetical protein
VVAGKLDLTESRSETAEDSQTGSRESKMDVKALLTAGLGLASGLFGATGLFFLSTAAIAETKSELAKALGAGLAALVAAFSASRTATKTTTRKTTLGREYKFIRDFKLDTLGRELPNLIERIRRAGLAPVFIVDELDKVPDLADNLRGLVRQLKPLVAERTFFCFLTDREYYEHLRAQSREIAYAPEHTYFTHRLFVTYPPEALGRYVMNSLHIVALNEAERENLRIDRFLTTLLILYRARMHAFDTNAELQRLAVRSTLSDPADRAKLGSDTEYLHPITYQLAVQTILDQREVKRRLGQDAYLRQVISDALYYPAEYWDRNAPSVLLSLDALRDHLATRMHLAARDRQTPRSLKQQTKAVAPAVKVERLLSREDLEFIFERLREMVDFLAHPQDTFPFRLEDTKAVPASIVKLIPKEPLLTIVGDECKFAFDAFGRPLEGLNDDQRQLLRDALTFVEEMNHELNEFTTALGDGLDLGSFAERFQILDRSPSWTFLQPTLAHLKQARDRQTIDGDTAKEALVAIKYADNLRRHSVSIGLALACAQAIQLKLTAGDPPQPTPAAEASQLAPATAPPQPAPAAEASQLAPATATPQAAPPTASPQPAPAAATPQPAPAAEASQPAPATATPQAAPPTASPQPAPAAATPQAAPPTASPQPAPATAAPQPAPAVPPPSLGRVLDAVTAVYQFARLTPADVERSLQDRAKELLGDDKNLDRFRTVNPVAVGACQLDAAQKEKIRLDSAGRDLAQVRAELWTRFRTRLIEYRRNPTSSYDPTLDDVLCLAADVSPVTLLSRNLEEMTIARWTTILRLAFADQTETAPDYVPLWMGVFAALELRLPAVGADLAHMKPPTFSVPAIAEAESAEWKKVLESIDAPALQPVPQRDDFLLVFAADNSPALTWKTSTRAVGLVTREADLMRAVTALFPTPSGPTAQPVANRRIILRESATVGASLPPLPVLPLFSGVQEWKLVWGADVAAAAGSPSVVAGANSIDELRLPNPSPS